MPAQFAYDSYGGFAIDESSSHWEIAVDGTPFGSYRLVELLGRGGMGEVWRAFDTATNRVVAVKVLPAHLAADPEFEQRFRREALAAAALNNPHVIPIHTFGEIDGRLFVDMRLIEGSDLQAVIAKGPLDPSRAVRIVEQVAKALHAAHKVGLIHRDVKPSNILLDDDDFAYLIDFGIVRSADEVGLTSTGAIIGTFHYMAPERMGAHQVDGRSDIYALACVLYEALTGQRPYPGDSRESQVAAHLTAPPPRPTAINPGVPPEFDAVIATGMAKQPDQRYPTTVELAVAARDAITAPIPKPSPTPRETEAATDVAPVREPQPPREEAPQPVSAHRAAATVLRPTTAPTPNPLLASPPTVLAAPPKPWWRRKAVLIPAATVIVVVVAVKTFGLAIPDSTDTTAPAAQTVLPSLSSYQPSGVAVSTNDTVYVTGGPVRMLVPGTNAFVRAPFTGVDVSTGVAVGADGSVYVSEQFNKRVLKLTPGGTQVELPFTGLSGVSGVAVGTDNTVYVTDAVNNRVLKLAPGDTQVELPFTGLNLPIDVAVGTDNTVYVTDGNNNRVLKLAAGATAPVELPFTGLEYPEGVAVGSDNAVYVTDDKNSRVLKLAAGNTQVELPFTGLEYPDGVAVGSDNAVYVSDTSNYRVVKLTQG